MDKIEKDARVEAVRNYLQAIGCTLSSTQVHEVVARASGLKNKHVLAAQTVGTRGKSGRRQALTLPSEHLGIKVFTLTDQPFSVAQMEELGWTFDVIVPVPLGYLGEIQLLNDHVSRVITGDDAALEDIQFEHVPEIVYGQGFVAQRVRGYVSSPEDFFDEIVADADVRFYADLLELTQKLRVSTTATLLVENKQLDCSIRDIGDRALEICERYATTHGSSNDEVNRAADEVILVLVPQDSEQAGLVTLVLGDLKHATKLDDTTWAISIGRCSYQLRF